MILCQLTRAVAAYAPDSSVQANEVAPQVVDARADIFGRFDARKV